MIELHLVLRVPPIKPAAYNKDEQQADKVQPPGQTPVVQGEPVAVIAPPAKSLGYGGLVLKDA
ncbi:MAG: hypothetical protein Q7U18_05720 [Methylobacter sp.]|nr:hypothetical protein [Methylobacter sp.]